MKKFMIKAIPIVTLAFFVLIMLSDNIMKRPLGKNDDIPGSIQITLKAVNEEKWDAAQKSTETLEKAWKKVVRRVQFSAEKDELNALDVNLARLRGAIMTKNKSDAVLELSEAYEHWDNIGK